MWRTKSDSGPNATRRTAECSPSAPITRSNRRGWARSKVTPTPCSSSSRATIVSLNRNSAWSRLAWYRIDARSPRGSSTSRLPAACCRARRLTPPTRSEEHTSELQSQSNLVCRLLLEKKKKKKIINILKKKKKKKKKKQKKK